MVVLFPYTNVILYVTPSGKVKNISFFFLARAKIKNKNLNNFSCKKKIMKNKNISYVNTYTVKEQKIQKKRQDFLFGTVTPITKI